MDCGVALEAWKADTGLGFWNAGTGLGFWKAEVGGGAWKAETGCGVRVAESWGLVDLGTEGGAAVCAMGAGIFAMLGGIPEKVLFRDTPGVGCGGSMKDAGGGGMGSLGGGGVLGLRAKLGTGGALVAGGCEGQEIRSEKYKRLQRRFQSVPSQEGGNHRRLREIS